MTHAEVLQIIGGLFGCWVSGYTVAFIIKTVKQFSEKV